MVEPNSLLDRFMPHGMCYQWRPDILWLNVISDSIIAFAYFLIAAALIYYMRKKPAVTYPAMVYLFSLFITACGFTHLLGIWTVWHGQYGIQGLVKGFTAATSIATAIVLYPLIPKLLALKTPRELEEANEELQRQVEQRKLSEQESLKLQGEIARFGRITTVGQMATGLAHELNQPLLAISASADTAVHVAKTIPAAEPLLFECLEDVQKDTERAGEIIRALRQFVSKTTTERVLVDINSLVKQAVQLVNVEVRSSNIELVVESRDVPAINANGVQISQVVVNLLRNAVEAISDNPLQNAEKRNRVKIVSDYDGNEVTVSVSDTGPGIVDSADMFEALESKKSDGMGVGLSISRDIVEAHGGKLEFEANNPFGARFTFSLPAGLH